MKKISAYILSFFVLVGSVWFSYVTYQEIRDTKYSTIKKYTGKQLSISEEYCLIQKGELVPALDNKTLCNVKGSIFSTEQFMIQIFQEPQDIPARY